MTEELYCFPMHGPECLLWSLKVPKIWCHVGNLWYKPSFSLNSVRLNDHVSDQANSKVHMLVCSSIVYSDTGLATSSLLAELILFPLQSNCMGFTALLDFLSFRNAEF
jgi:hypothetical protein